MTAATAAKPNKARAEIRESTFSIGDRAVFLAIHFSCYGNRRMVAGSNVEVDADKRMISISKRLVESEELQEIIRLDRAALNYVRDLCLPFDKATHILPLEAIERVDAYLREKQAERERLVDRFIDRYPALRAAAIEPLGSLYNEDDYETAEELRGEFRMRWQYVGFSVPGKLKEVSPALFAEERAKIQERMQETFEEIRSVLRVGMLELVTRLRASLEPGQDGKMKRLTSPSVEKLQQFLETFTFRNITDDAELARVTDQVRVIVSGVSAEQLRESDALRERVRDTMAEVGSKLETMAAGRRKFRFSAPAE